MIPDRLGAAVDAIRSLEHESRYLGALIFGSVAEGEADHHSDLDVIVLVDEDNPCPNINHPGYWGHKVDISFRSIRQITELAEMWRRNGARRSSLARAMILFDKTGELPRLQQRVFVERRAPATRNDRQDAAALIYHIDDKVRRNLREDPGAALYCMHVGIGELLDQHFRLHGEWWFGSKKVLRSLDRWDRPGADLVRNFLATADVEDKFAAWSAVVEHILAPLGGRRPIGENNCGCPVCTADLTALRDAVATPALPDTTA